MGKLKDVQDEEKLLLNSDDGITLHRQNKSHPGRMMSRLTPTFSTNLSGIFTLLSWNLICCLAVFLVTRHSLERCDCIAADSESWELYSPVLKEKDFPFHRKQFEAKLYPNFSDPATIFAQPPSPEVDAAWERISDNMIYGITRDDVLRVGKDPETAVKFNPEWDASSYEGDEELYLAEVEVFHQIHCLNSLRMGLLQNYDHYFGKSYGFSPPALYETHTRHCTWILLQSIMCRADLGVVTHRWSAGQPQPWPDFAVNKQCRDFDALLEWKEKRDLPDAHKKFSTYIAPPDASVMPIEQGEMDERAGASGLVDGEYVKELRIKNCNA